MAKFYIKVTDVELGMELDMEELVTFGEAISEALTPELIDKFEALLTKANKKVVPEPEEDQEEDDDPDAERRDELIKDLRDLGYKVTEVDKDAKVKCKTYASDMAKYKFVKSWLKTGDIKYEESTTCTGRLCTEYELSGNDVIALANYLKDNEVDNGTILV